MTSRPPALIKHALLASTLFATLALAACSKQEAPAPAATEVAAPAATTEPAATASTEAAAPAPAPTPEAPNTNPVLPPQGPAPVAGTDFEEIAGGQPYQPLNGKIEVVEVFGYICPACARFQPVVNGWKKKLPADVRFTYVPAPFGPEWQPYAKAYYVAEGMGLVERSHDAVVEAIHLKNTLPAEGQKPDEAKVAAFYAAYGANPQEFLSTMNSFAIDAKINRGKQFMLRSGVQGTPTIVINGKYRITGGQSYEDVLRIADHLIARERAAAQAPAATPAPAAPASGG